MENEDEQDFISKSQRKRDMLALQDLGAKLLELSEEKLRTLELPDKLQEAVLAGKRITQHGARKRQIQYIGKIMRQVDAEPIREALDAMNQTSAVAKAAFHRLEQWREQLLSEDDGKVSEFLQAYPESDSQYLRQLIRNAKQEMATNKPPRNFRKLFQYLKEVIDH